MVQVDTAGWLERTRHDKGPASLSVMQSRKNLMMAHAVALLLDAEEVRHILHWSVAVFCQCELVMNLLVNML